MKTIRTLAATAVAVTSLVGSAFAAPVIFMYGAGGHALTENVSAKFEDVTHFGSVATDGGTKTYSYYIRNHGDANLVINNVGITGSGAANFIVSSPPDAAVAPNSFTSFDITFDPAADGVSNAKVTVGTNAPANALFEYSIAGTGASSVPAKPDLASSIPTLVKSKVQVKNGINYLKATYLVPIVNNGQEESTKKVSNMRVFASADRFLDGGDTSALKVQRIKKEIDSGDSYTMKVKVKLEIPPGTEHLIFQIESPDDYESRYSNNLRNELVP